MAVRKDSEGNEWSDESGKWAKVQSTPKVKIDTEGNQWVNEGQGWVKSTNDFNKDPFTKLLNLPGKGHTSYNSGLNIDVDTKDLVKRQQRNKELDYERELTTRGPEAQKRAEIAANTPWYKKMLLLAGDESKALGTGVKELMNSDLRDIASMTIGNMISPGMGSVLGRSETERESDALDLQEYKKERDIEKLKFKEMDESAVVTQIARAAPYLLTGLLEAPIAAGGRGVIKAITDVTRKNLPRSVNPGNRPSILSEYMSSGILGAAEGGLHEDEDIAQGGISSLLGRFGGRAIGNYLEKAPNTNWAGDNELIDRWMQKGYVASPGMRTGNQKEQIHDAAQASHPRFSEWYVERDKVNDQLFAEEMKKAAGFKLGDKDISSLSPDVINNHIKSLKTEYNHLEHTTKGSIPSDDFKSIESKISELDDADIVKVKKDFKRFTGGDVEADRAFDGKTYQDQLRHLKAGKKKALAESNSKLAGVYDDMMHSLANGLESGMKKDQVERWRDLNERWAMSKLMIEKGVGPNQRVDADKLLKSITSSDMDRLVTGKGGRIRGFHDLVRMKDLDNKQKNPGMGEGVTDLSDREKKARLKAKPTFWSGPEKSGITPMDKAIMNLQYNGLFGQPRKVYGLLGNPSEGIGSTGSIMRAFEQGTDGKADALNWLSDPESRFNEAKDYVTSLLD